MSAEVDVACSDDEYVDDEYVDDEYAEDEDDVVDEDEDLEDLDDVDEVDGVDDDSEYCEDVVSATEELIDVLDSSSLVADDSGLPCVPLGVLIKRYP